MVLGMPFSVFAADCILLLGSFCSFKHKKTVWVGRPERLRLLTSVSFIDQMSKSTGNFLTLSQAIDKFSADGIISFFLIYLSFCLFYFFPSSQFSSQWRFHLTMKPGRKHFRCTFGIDFNCVFPVHGLLWMIILLTSLIPW